VLFYFVVVISARVPTGEVWPTPFFFVATRNRTGTVLFCFFADILWFCDQR
jgi:hypothetical protein